MYADTMHSMTARIMQIMIQIMEFHGFSGSATSMSKLVSFVVVGVRGRLVLLSQQPDSQHLSSCSHLKHKEHLLK